MYLIRNPPNLLQSGSRKHFPPSRELHSKSGKRYDTSTELWLSRSCKAFKFLRWEIAGIDCWDCYIHMPHSNQCITWTIPPTFLKLWTNLNWKTIYSAVLVLKKGTLSQLPFYIDTCGTTLEEWKLKCGANIPASQICHRSGAERSRLNPAT